jgi:hypothetical protein
MLWHGWVLKTWTSASSFFHSQVLVKWQDIWEELRKYELVLLPTMLLDFFNIKIQEPGAQGTQSLGWFYNSTQFWKVPVTTAARHPRASTARWQVGGLLLCSHCPGLREALAAVLQNEEVSACLTCSPSLAHCPAGTQPCLSREPQETAPRSRRQGLNLRCGHCWSSSLPTGLPQCRSVGRWPHQSFHTPGSSHSHGGPSTQSSLWEGGKVEAQWIDFLSQI